MNRGSGYDFGSGQSDYGGRNRGGGRGGGRGRGGRGRGRGRGGGRGGGGGGAEKVPERVFLTPSQVMDNLRRLGAAMRDERYGKAGEHVDLTVNCYPTDLADLRDIIYHYDVTLEEIEKDDDSTSYSRGGRGGVGSRGRGRGRGGRQSDKPVPVRIATRVIKKCEQEERVAFNNAKIAYDGRKNAYTAICPTFYQHGTKENSRTCVISLEEMDYNVTFRMVNEVPMRELNEYVAGVRRELPQECVTALDVVLRTAPMRELVYTGRGFSWQPPESMAQKLRIGQGCEAWTTYYQAFRPQESGMMLTFDVMHTAIYTVQTVSELALEILKGPSARDQQDMGEEILHRPLSPMDVKKLSNELRGLRVHQLSQSDSLVKEYAIDHVTLSSADRMEFEECNRSLQSVTVAQHYANNGNMLRYPHLPCVAVKISKDKDSTTLLPLEQAKIAPGQRRLRPLTAEMKERLSKIGTRNPESRLEQITAGLGEINVQTKEYLAAFGVKVNIDRLRIPGRVLPPPKIQLGGGTSLDLTDNSNFEYAWNLRSLKLHDTETPLVSWGLLVLAPVNKRDVGRFVECIRVTCLDMGLQTNEPRVKFGYPQTLQRDMVELFAQVTDCQLIMVIKENESTIDYNEIKNISDTHLGVPSQCVVLRHVLDPKPLYCRNLVLKINAKIGGINMRIPANHFDKIGKNFMVIGATVAHAPPISRLGTPDSVVSVVGSLDRRAGRHACTYRFQDPKLPYIDDFGDMCGTVLRHFNEVWGFLPETLIIFRNGVSDGYFSNVLDLEVRDIKKMCSELGRELHIPFDPKITFIVVQRGHHCRFIPVDEEKRDLSHNCAPGTVVDSHIAHPRLYDFFIVAHNGIQGVSRPTRYTVLLDDVNFDADALQDLVYALCYTFQRANRSVSIVPAVYYADLVASRMRRCLTSRSVIKELEKVDNRAPIRKELPVGVTEGIPVIAKHMARVFFFI